MCWAFSLKNKGCSDIDSKAKTLAGRCWGQSVQDFIELDKPVSRNDIFKLDDVLFRVLSVRIEFDGDKLDKHSIIHLERVQLFMGEYQSFNERNAVEPSYKKCKGDELARGKRVAQLTGINLTK